MGRFRIGGFRSQFGTNFSTGIERFDAGLVCSTMLRINSLRSEPTIAAQNAISAGGGAKGRVVLATRRGGASALR